MFKPRPKTSLGLLAAALCAFVAPSAIAQVSVPPELQKKIDTHPNTRQLTYWGSRPEWSADSKRLIFLNKEFGDVYELDVATGKSLPLTYGYPHEGILRAYYLQDGNFLFTASPERNLGLEVYNRILESELWVLKKDLSGPAIRLNVRNSEGVAVARQSMRIAFLAPAKAALAKPRPKFPGDRPTISSREIFDAIQKSGEAERGIVMGDVVIEGDKARIANERTVVSCAAGGPLAKAIESIGQKCVGMEPQNFVPTDESKLTFTALTRDAKRPIIVHTFVVDLKTGAVTKLNPGDAHAEVEGIFADGKNTLVEHSPEKDSWLAGMSVDLWKVPLDGSGRMTPVTQYNRLDPELKSNQGVVSPDGRWLAFTVATRSMEKVSAGQGVGLFLLDLRKAGL